MQNVEHTGDRVAVVRCKDCKNWDYDWLPLSSADGSHFCPQIDLVTKPDFYCSDGERKGE